MLERRSLWRHYRLPVANLFEAYALAVEAGLIDLCDATIGDGFHPRSKSGGWVAAAILAPIRQALASMNSTFEQAHSRGTPLPPPLHIRAAAGRRGLMCFSFDQEGYALATANKLSQAQQAWSKARGNRVELRSIAKFGVMPHLVKRDGWDFVAKEEKSRTRDKPGIAAERPGAVLTFELALPAREQSSEEQAQPSSTSSYAAAGGESTAAPPPAAAPRTAAAPRVAKGDPPGACILVLEHLTSYEGQGRVRVQCAGGCECSSKTIDASKGGLRSGSVLRPSRVPLQWDVAMPCQVEMRVLNETSSSGTRFKLARILLEERRNVVATPQAADNKPSKPSASASNGSPASSASPLSSSGTLVPASTKALEEALIERFRDAKRGKDFVTADRIREEMRALTKSAVPPTDAPAVAPSSSQPRRWRRTAPGQFEDLM